MHTQRTFQLSFHAVPGQEPQPANDSADTWLPGTPWRTVPADDNEALSDATIELSDWALEACPAAFEMAGDDHATNYEAYNDASIEMARKIAAATEPADATIDPRHGTNPHAWSKWFKDAELASGVVVRVHCFEKPART